MSKSLAELAEDYLTEAERIKKKIAELEATADRTNEADYNHRITIYEDMLADCMLTYRLLKDYYEE